MTKILKSAAITGLALTLGAPLGAAANDIQDCELVLIEAIKDDSGKSGAQVASYRPASDFLGPVYEGKEVAAKIDDLDIRAVMCMRNDVIATKADFKVLALGIPFVLSQDFDSPDTDLITYYYKDGKFRYQHKGPDMSDEAKAALEKRMAAFNQKTHNLK